WPNTMSMDSSRSRIPPPTRTPARLMPMMRRRSSPKRANTSSMPDAMRVVRKAIRRCSTREAFLASTAKRAAPLIGLTVTKRAVKDPRTKAVSMGDAWTLALHRAGGEPAHHVLVQIDVDEHDRERREGGRRHQLAPEREVGDHELREPDRQRPKVVV